MKATVPSPPKVVVLLVVEMSLTARRLLGEEVVEWQTREGCHHREVKGRDMGILVGVFRETEDLEVGIQEMEAKEVLVEGVHHSQTETEGGFRVVVGMDRQEEAHRVSVVVECQGVGLGQMVHLDHQEEMVVVGDHHHSQAVEDGCPGP